MPATSPPWRSGIDYLLIAWQLRSLSSETAPAVLFLPDRAGIKHVDGIARRVGENLIDHDPVVKLIVIPFNVAQMRRGDYVIHFKQRVSSAENWFVFKDIHSRGSWATGL